MKRRHAGSIVLALAAAAGIAAAQPKSIAPGTASLAGRIVDDDSRLPIEAAMVTLVNRDAVLHTLTDEQGRYLIEGVAAGEYQLIAEKEGYSGRRSGRSASRFSCQRARRRAVSTRRCRAAGASADA